MENIASNAENTQRPVDWGYKCFHCGYDLVWEADFMGSEIGAVELDYDSEQYDEDADFIVGLYNCPHCGMHYEVHSCPNKDRKDYPAYEEYKQNKEEQ